MPFTFAKVEFVSPRPRWHRHIRCATYADIGVTFIHHNIDRGKVGMILDVDTSDQLESVNIEVDAAGRCRKTWNMAQIISDAMIAGGDDPSQFVYPAPD